jgi:phenol 2-monooxygenase (NADPH)
VHVLRGWADISLLKTVRHMSTSVSPSLRLDTQYEFERRKYAQELISFDKRFSALFSEKLRVDSEGHGPTHEEFIG